MGRVTNLKGQCEKVRGRDPGPGPTASSVCCRSEKSQEVASVTRPKLDMVQSSLGALQEQLDLAQIQIQTLSGMTTGVTPVSLSWNSMPMAELWRELPEILLCMTRQMNDIRNTIADMLI